MNHGTNPPLGDARLDRLLAQVMAERAEDVYAAALPAEAISERIAGRPRFAWVRQGATLGVRGSLALLALVALLAFAAVAAFVVGSRLGPPPSQLAVAAQIVEAVNTRNLESVRSLLAEDGVLEFPSVDGSAGREGEIHMSDWEMNVENFPEVWMGSLDRWGMQAHLRSCREVASSTISCAVVTRWRTLQVEIGEAWTFEFDGRRVTRLQMLRVDPDPPDRLLPLGLADLTSWESWLRETHPAQAARLLPSGPDLFGHMYFRFGLDASLDEIGDSIREYIETRP
jgi:hypothetical protein